MRPEPGTGARRPRALRCALLALVAGALWAGGAQSQRDQRFLEKVEPPREPVPERPVRLPSVPTRSDLVELDGALFDGGVRVFLDPASLSQARPGVVRYTMLLVSVAGVENLFYESIHCENKEWRTLAFGTPEGEFRLVAGPRWRSLRAGGSTGYRRALARAYVCVMQRRTADRAADLRRRLRRGGASDSGYEPFSTR